MKGDYANFVTKEEHDEVFRVKRVSNFVDDGSGSLIRERELDRFDLTTTDPIAVALTDANGDQMVALSLAVPDGSGVNGTVALASANTWYAVPSTVPTADYVLLVSIENGLGTVRFGFSNSGTPSVTNGNAAPGVLEIRMAANQSLYYASTTAGDDVNWTTKVI